MDVKAKAITQAVRLLQAAGAQFKVIADDGTEFGELEVAAQKIRSCRRGHFAATGYLQKLEAMEVGGVEILRPEQPEDLESLRGSVCGKASRLFGRGNYTTVVNDGAVEILRIA